MNLLPLGFNIFIIIGFLLASGMGCPISVADYSISTLIETTGPVQDRFSGAFSQADENGTYVSGVYSDSVMTNDGIMSLSKQVSMTGDKSTNHGFDTQKILKYSSGLTGGHLIADEYILTSSDNYINETNHGSTCFGETCAAPACVSKENSASFSIINAKNLVMSSSGRSSDGTMDYIINIDSPDNNTSEGGLEGTIITAYHGNIKTPTSEVALYDRTLVSGLIDTFSRWYHAEEQLDLIAASSVSGAFHDKTIMEQKFSQNNTATGEILSGTTVYSQDVITSGGRTDETRQITASDSITAERIIEYSSDGDRSIQVSEHAIATRIDESNGNSESQTCVLGENVLTADEKSPYKEAAAETGITGVSSAKISSSTHIANNQHNNDLNLEYRANIMIPAGFNESLVMEMKDNDNDGRFEDLNGNGRLDMHDLVLLFQNFRWIGESNLSLRIDFNKNGRADFADIVTLFNYMNMTSSK